MSHDFDPEMEKRIAAEVTRRVTVWKGAEESLARRERKHRILSEGSPEVIARFDRQLRHTFINDHGARFYGLPKEEVIGRTHAELGMPAEIVSLWRHHLEEVLASRREQKVNLEFDSPGGGHQCLSSLLLPEFDEQGEVASILTIARDITVLIRTEAELKESEERYRSIFEQAAVGIVYADLAGRFFRTNPKMTEITGYTESELAALTFQEITHPDDLQADLDHLRRLTPGEIHSFQMEKRYRRKNGSAVWVHLTASTVRDESGKPKYYVGIIEDIEDRKRAEQALRESERRFKNTFENAAVGMAHVGLDGRFIRFNGSLCRITGYPAEELSGLTFQEITHQDDLGVDLAHIRAILKGEKAYYSTEKRYIHKDGSLVWINLTVSLQREDQGEPKYFISVIEDISERKRAEEELKRTVAELARSNRELEQFAYIASHDLQTPLRSITCFLDLLARRYKGKLGPDADEFIAFAVGGAERMHQLINDILVFSRVGIRGKPFERLESREPLERALGNLQAALEESGAEVMYDELPLVTADRNQLVQLFQNLVENAVKYRKPAEPPRIHIAATEKEGAWEFRVTDNGIGIAPEYGERIFEIFQRLHTIGEYPGTGIGLAICKKIVERHGGRIWVESEPGTGSDFYFTLPTN
jgi:PAS domain S-box-containing protein